MKTVEIAEFQDDVMRFLLEAANGEPITLVVQKHKMVKLSPLTNSMEEARKALKELSKTAVVEDVLAPIDED